jgi:hypothetical protein
MPYIKEYPRAYLQTEIADLAQAMGDFGPSERPGVMNYTISKLIKDVYGKGLKYAQYNEIIGFLECCKLEFYRAQVGPYEEVKRKENGEV